MKNLLGIFTLAVSAALLPSAVYAQPQLFVTYEGVNPSGNNTWAARISPDPDLFTDTTSGYGSSLAIELAFAVEGSEFLSITKDAANYDFDNPGMNPFTAPAYTQGIWIDDNSTQAFASLGGRVFGPADPTPHDVLFFETLGDQPTTLMYGTAASGDDRLGTLIAQLGLEFSVPDVPVSLAAISPSIMGGNGGMGELTDNLFFGFTGSVSSIPEPSSLAIGFGLLVAILVGHKRLA